MQNSIIEGKKSKYQYNFVNDFFMQRETGCLYNGTDVKNQAKVIVKISHNFDDRSKKVLDTIKDQGPLKNVISILEVIEFEQKSYKQLITISEKAKGDLQDYLKTNQNKMDICWKLHLCYQIINGIAEIHRLGFMHRDIKPNNILYFLDDQNAVTLKICDIDETRAIQGSQKTSDIGTQGYNAPETEIENYQYDEKIDIWSFGIVMFEIISGNKMTQKEDINKQIDNLIIDPQLKMLLQQMIQIDPKMRFDSISIKQNLGQYLLDCLYKIGIKFSIEDNCESLSLENVLKIYDELIEYNSEAIIQKGQWLTKMKLGDQALKHFDQFLSVVNRLKILRSSNQGVKIYYNQIQSFQSSLRNVSLIIQQTILGNSLIQMKKYKKAKQILENIVQFFKSHDNLFEVSLLKQNGLIKYALQCCNKLIEQDPENQFANYKKADLLIDQNHISEPIQYWDELIIKEKNKFMIYYMKVDWLMKKEFLTPAIQSLDDLFENFPKKLQYYQNLYFELVKLLKMQGSFEQGIKYLNDLFKKTKEFQFWLIKGDIFCQYLADILLKLEGIASAVDSWADLLQHGFNYYEVQEKKADWLKQQGLFSQAIENLDQLIKSNPQNYQLYEKKGETFLLHQLIAQLIQRSHTQQYYFGINQLKAIQKILSLKKQKVDICGIYQ